MKTFKRALALLLVVVMVAAMASCGDNSWIVKYNGREVPTGVYTYFVYNAYQMLSYYGTVDGKTKLTEQTISTESTTESDAEDKGERADKYIDNYAFEQVLYLCELWDRYEAAGLSLDEATLAGIAADVDAEYAQFEEMYTKNGVAKSSIEIASAQGKYGAMQQQLFDYTYGAGGTKEVTDADLETYFKENYVGYSYIYQSLRDSNGTAELSDTEKQAIKTELEGIKKDVDNGKKSFEAVAQEYSAYNEDGASGKYGVTRTVVQKNDESELMKALLELKAGECSYLELNGYAFLLQRYDPMDNKYFEDADNKASILSSYKYSEFQDDIMNTAKAADYELNKNSYKSFGIRKLKIDGVVL